jgi:phytoene dehydrogenase-like protein
MRNTNYWQFDDYDAESYYRAEPLDASFKARAVYITSASLKDPEGAHHHAPDGVTNVEVMSIVPGSIALWGVEAHDAEAWRYRESERYHAIKASLEAQMVARIDNLFPGAGKAVVYRESATPVSHVRFTRATEGTGYGLAATPDQFLRKRPGYRGPLPGLYFCGASTRAGHGIVGAMTSGRQAALRIAADLGRKTA